MWLLIVGVAPSSLSEDLATLVCAEGRAIGVILHDSVCNARRDRVCVCRLMVMELS